MMNRGFISGYNVIQEVITFTVALLHKYGANAVAVVLMLFYQMSGQPSYGKSVESQNVTH
jgi:hypothetical protein